MRPPEFSAFFPRGPNGPGKSPPPHPPNGNPEIKKILWEIFGGGRRDFFGFARLAVPPRGPRTPEKK